MSKKQETDEAIYNRLPNWWPSDFLKMDRDFRAARTSIHLRRRLPHSLSWPDSLQFHLPLALIVAIEIKAGKPIIKYVVSLLIGEVG